MTDSDQRAPTRGRRAADTEGSSMMTPESWQKILTKLGGYGAIAAYLVYQLSSDIKVTSAETLRLMTTHTASGAVLEQSIGRLVNVTLQTCINQAGTVQARKDACFRSLYIPPTPTVQ
jgi:hypothetical protein